MSKVPSPVFRSPTDWVERVLEAAAGVTRKFDGRPARSCYGGPQFFGTEFRAPREYQSIWPPNVRK